MLTPRTGLRGEAAAKEVTVMKNSLIISIAFIALIACAACAADSPPTGVRYGGELIAPGKSVAWVIGVMGPPDWFRAMRGKDTNSDYVMFEYRNPSIIIHIDNRTNNVKSIYVDDREVSIESVPFRVGESAKKVTAAWGEPENEQSNILVYWKRGVYVAVDDSGVIGSITLSEPGKITDQDKEQYEKEKGKSGSGQQ
jgi:hypothetical protein